MDLTTILWVIASPSFNTASTSLINKTNSWKTVFITRNKHATLKSFTSTSLETLETATQNVHMLIFKTSVRQKQPKNPQGHGHQLRASMSAWPRDMALPSLGLKITWDTDGSSFHLPSNHIQASMVF